MSRRRKHKTIDELIAVGIIAEGMYLVLRYAAGTSGTTAAFAGVALGSLLVGLCLRPWADRLARRFGIRIVPVGTPVRKPAPPKDGTTPKGKRP